MDEQILEFDELLGQIKSDVKQVVAEIGDAGLTWTPDVPDTNSVAVLVTHMFGSEAASVHEQIGGNPVNRDRDSEFADPITTVDGLTNMIESVGQRTRETLAKETAESLKRVVPGSDANSATTAHRRLIGVLMHQAEHIGHLQLTEQLRQAQLD